MKRTPEELQARALAERATNPTITTYTMDEGVERRQSAFPMARVNVFNGYTFDDGLAVLDRLLAARHTSLMALTVPAPQPHPKDDEHDRP